MVNTIDHGGSDDDDLFLGEIPQNPVGYEGYASYSNPRHSTTPVPRNSIYPGGYVGEQFLLASPPPQRFANSAETLETPFSHNRHQTSSTFSSKFDDEHAYEYCGSLSLNTLPGQNSKSNSRNDLDFPENVYSPRRNDYTLYSPYSPYSGPSYRPQSYQDCGPPLTHSGEDYIINPLEDIDDDMDPFGDDASLYSETGEDIVRRATIRRSGTKKSKDGKIEEKQTYDDNDDDDYKPALRYTKTVKKARLVNGNYIIDAPVPETLFNNYGGLITDGGKEMSLLRYTACICGPSNFMTYGYNLRQGLYSPPRETEIMVCVTMYNEDELSLARTLKGIFDNIENLTRRRDPTWGEDSWKRVVVTIVSDGRAAFDERSQNLLAALGVYQDGYAKSKINEKKVKAHIYEYTTTVGIDRINERVHLCSNSSPVQIIFCLKEKNGRKINSHRWCFQSFAPIIKPRVVILLDCGTMPAYDSFYHLWKSFRDPSVAGACGEIQIALGQGKRELRNPLVAAQNFEYKIANILDKPMESVFGFISVLPGAFSAYRYEALLNVDGKGPLEKYFKGEFLHQDNKVGNDDDDDEKELKERNYHEAGIFASNMYLAEDRILCFELVAKKHHSYVLRYVNEAKAETDAPNKIDDFVLQRRRWLNGSLFAAAYAVVHWTKIWKSNHSLLRKLFLQLEFYYQLVTLLVSWFSMASFFLVFRILTANVGADDMNFDAGKYISVICLWVYLGSLVCTFVLAFGNTPRGTKKFYLAISVIFAILMAYMIFATIYLAVHTMYSVIKDHENDFVASMLMTNYKFRDLVVSVASTYLLYFIGAFMYGEPSFMFTSFAQYLALSPSYINVLNIYSFCNIHDISWGTRQIDNPRDLGSARSTGHRKDELVMVAPGDAQELNDAYNNALENLRTIPVQPTRINDKKEKDDAYYAFVRTVTVLVWLLTNVILIAIVLETFGVSTLANDSLSLENKDGSIGGNSTVFLTVILWVVAGLAAFRFIGSTLYMIFKVFRPLKWRLRQPKLA
ncbi:uncharacterized protein PRCAT00003062001 [Priceomyces carsonii]|uniref:uncharacterized protein n=1 Tax=Priceomyces carsonii TaxID=28549 RepID=UPI002EDAAA1C|nr:unnamed protein product [Priceomyces carsonii]